MKGTKKGGIDLVASLARMKGGRPTHDDFAVVFGVLLGSLPPKVAGALAREVFTSKAEFERAQRRYAELYGAQSGAGLLLPH